MFMGSTTHEPLSVLPCSSPVMLPLRAELYTNTPSYTRKVKRKDAGKHARVHVRQAGLGDVAGHAYIGLRRVGELVLSLDAVKVILLLVNQGDLQAQCANSALVTSMDWGL